MALASKRWVRGQLYDIIGPVRPRRLEAPGTTFPWEKCSFGYKINPDGDNRAEVMVYAGGVETGLVFSSVYGLSSMAWTTDTKVNLTPEGVGSYVVYVWGRIKTTSGADPYPSVDARIDIAVPSNEWWKAFPLYQFTVETTGGDDPELYIDDAQTKILRFLNIETDVIDTGEVIEDGTAKNPHLIWNITEEKWEPNLIYEDYAFGFRIGVVYDNVVTVNAGKIRHGTRAPILVASTDITIAAGTDPTWIYVRYAYGSGVATILGSTTEPTDTEEVHYHVLHRWLLYSGVANLVQNVGAISHIGDIFIPGAFA